MHYIIQRVCVYNSINIDDGIPVELLGKICTKVYEVIIINNVLSILQLHASVIELIVVRARYLVACMLRDITGIRGSPPITLSDNSPNKDREKSHLTHCARVV